MSPHNTKDSQTKTTLGYLTFLRFKYKGKNSYYNSHLDSLNFSLRKLKENYSYEKIVQESKTLNLVYTSIKNQLI